ESQRDNRRQRCGKGGELLLPVAPGEILDHENAQSAKQMHCEQEHKPDLRDFDQRLIGPAQKTCKSRFAFERETQRQKGERKKDRECQPRNTMQHGSDPWAAAAMFNGVCAHGSTTAATARRPSPASTMPMKTAQASVRRSESGDHSLSTLRTPIEA